MSQKHSHYHKDVSHLKSIDIYRLLELFDVTDQAIGHAVKKLMCAGKRGSKSFEQDVREAVDTLNRRLQMIAEDDAPRAPQMATGYKPPAPIQVQAPAPMPSVPVAHVGGFKPSPRWEVGTRLRLNGPSSEFFTEGSEYEIQSMDADGFSLIDDQGREHAWTVSAAVGRFVRA